MGAPTPHTAWLNGRGYHVARVALLALACALVVAALLMLAFTSGQLSRTQQVAADLVQSQTRAEVLVIASHSDSDAATQQQRDGLIDLLNRSEVAVDVEYLDVEGSAMARNVPNATEGTDAATIASLAARATEAESAQQAANGSDGSADQAQSQGAGDQNAQGSAQSGQSQDSGAQGAPARIEGSEGAEGGSGTTTTTTTTTITRPANANPIAASLANLGVSVAFADTDTTNAAATTADTTAGATAAGAQAQFATGDTAAHGQALLQSTWGQALAAKIADHGAYSAVICIDDDALCYVEAAHDALFSQTPVVFLGVNDAAHAQRMFDLGYATGLVESADIAAFMSTAQAMRPSATSVLVLSDDTPTGIGYRAQLQQAAESFADLPLTYVNASQLSRADLAKRVSEAGEDAIVLYLDATTDSAGNAYTASQSAYFISEAAGQPVFSLCFNGVGEGFAGSTFVDYASEGQRAGDMVIMILNGTRPADIALETFTSDGSVYDSAVLSNYRINTSALPASAVTLHTSGLSTDALRPIFMPIMLLVLGIACLIAFAFLGYRRTASDMTDIVTQRNLLEQRFYTDSLTEMPNMQWLTAYAGSDASTRIRSIVEVMLLDFDHIDDLRGSGTADAVVKVLADRLNGLDKAFLVRPGSSEFILGVEHDLDASSPLLKKMERLLRRPIPLAGDSVTVDPCIGVYNREPGMSIEEMVSGVDLAIRQAEQLGMNGEVIFYDADMRTAVEHKLDITTHIRRAIEKDGFIVVYQPQVDLASNEVVGYEALLRMRGDHYPPEQFIPVAEMNGQIVDIDRIVTKKVVGQLATWKKRKQRMRPVSINYGYGQLRDDDYIEYLVGLLDEHGVSHALIRMDIREGLFLNDMAKATGFVEELGEAGFSIAIDGFGAGLTQLSHITEIPADAVKIDRTVTASFFAGGDASVIANLVRLVHSANKLVVIEGVETLEQLQRCRAMGCDVVQGFFFSEPMLPEQAVRYKPAPLPPVPANLLAEFRDPTEEPPEPPEDSSAPVNESEPNEPEPTTATEPALEPEPKPEPTTAAQPEDATTTLEATKPEAKTEHTPISDAATKADEPSSDAAAQPASKPKTSSAQASRAAAAAASDPAADSAPEPELASESTSAPTPAAAVDQPAAKATIDYQKPRATTADTPASFARATAETEVAADIAALDTDGDAVAVEPAQTNAHAPSKGAGLEALFVSTTAADPATDSTLDAAQTDSDPEPDLEPEPTSEAALAPESALASESTPAPTKPADDLATSWATTPEEVVASFTAGPDDSAVIDIAFAGATPDGSPESAPESADDTPDPDEA